MAPQWIVFAGALACVVAVARWLIAEWRGTAAEQPGVRRYAADPADWSDVERIERGTVAEPAWWEAAL